MSEISCRLATADDIEALVRLRLAFLAEVGQAVAEANQLPEAIRAYFAATVPSGEFVAAVAEIGGVIVATSGMLYHRHPPSAKNPAGLSAYILNVYVQPAHRRRGIATQLLKMLADQARDVGCREARLHAMPQGQALYPTLGFVPVSLPEMKLEL
jgi:GNAT superfamily N-acetyltransferase